MIYTDNYSLPKYENSDSVDLINGYNASADILDDMPAFTITDRMIDDPTTYSYWGFLIGSAPYLQQTHPLTRYAESLGFFANTFSSYIALTFFNKNRAQYKNYWKNKILRVDYTGIMPMIINLIESEYTNQISGYYDTNGSVYANIRYPYDIDYSANYDTVQGWSYVLPRYLFPDNFTFNTYNKILERKRIGVSNARAGTDYSALSTILNPNCSTILYYRFNTSNQNGNNGYPYLDDDDVRIFFTFELSCYISTNFSVDNLLDSSFNTSMQGSNWIV